MLGCRALSLVGPSLGTPKSVEKTLELTYLYFTQVELWSPLNIKQIYSEGYTGAPTSLPKGYTYAQVVQLL